MKITRYGITLQRLRNSDIEMVRQWRNDPKISKFMFHHGEITTEMQEEWFHSIDNIQNFFFLIIYDQHPVGLINISSIDWENKTAFCGLFIYDEKYWGTDIPVLASLSMLDTFFLIYNLQVVYAKVRGNNKAAHRYNSSLGFERTKKIELGLGYEYMLQKELYLLETARLRNYAIRLRGNKTNIEFDVKHPVSAAMKKKIDPSNQHIFHALGLSVTECC